MYDSGMDDALVTIREFGEVTEALFAQGRLDSAGIESFLVDLEMARIDWPAVRGLKLQVASENVEEAIAILDDPATVEFEADEPR